LNMFNMCYLSVVLLYYCHRAEAQLQFNIHTHTHTHTHIYIYIYIYKCPGSKLYCSTWIRILLMEIDVGSYSSSVAMLAQFYDFYVFTAVTMKNTFFLDLATCGSCTNRRFGETCSLHYQNERIIYLGTLSVTANVPRSLILSL
jgi:hypothetical protein